MALSIDTKKAIAKLKNAQKALGQIADNIPRDAAAFFVEKAKSEQLAGAAGTAAIAKGGDRIVVGNQSSKLSNSVLLSQKERHSWEVYSDGGIAHYNRKIDNFVKFRTGKTFFQTTKFFYAPIIQKGAESEVNEMVNSINRIGSYRYQNPY